MRQVFRMFLPTLLALTSSWACAQELLLRFQHIPPEQSFASRQLADVVQDRRGFMWIASLYGGFARYDGYEFIPYRHDPGSCFTTIKHGELGKGLVLKMLRDLDVDSGEF
jgi:hypothetical protein